MAYKGICHSPITTHRWAKPAKARTNSGDVKKGPICNSPIGAYEWKKHGRDNSK